MQRHSAVAVGVAAILASSALPLAAQEPAVNLKVGDPAPAFEAAADSGETWKSSDVVGKKILVVYFYPADMTPGCTAQACGFRDDFEKLREKGVEVVGVSGDSVKNHQLFKQAEKLNFTLLADEKGELAKKFGVPTRAGGSITRNVGGQEHTLIRGVTASRWTFVIDKAGKVALKNTQVNAAQDSQAILKTVEELESSS